MADLGYRLVIVPDVILPNGMVYPGQLRSDEDERYLRTMRKQAWENARRFIEIPARENRNLTVVEVFRYNVLIAELEEWDARIRAVRR